MSTTDVRTFRAASMQQALEIVRREMGPEAVILHTRELPQPRLWFRKKTDERVEITAGTGLNVRTPRAIQMQSAAPRGAAPRTPAPTGSAPSPSVRPPTGPHPAPGTGSTSGAGPGLGSGGLSLETPDVLPLTPRRDDTYRVAPASATNAEPLAHRWPPPPQRSLVSVDDQQSQIARQLSSIQKMVESLTRVTGQRGGEVPAELFQLYTDLIDREVDEDLARDLVCRLKQTLPDDALAQVPQVRQQLCGMVESEIRIARPIATTPGKRRVVALVGPTGVGKTTTIAKLAANFRLRDGVKMGLVTVDTYRIAAVEQLRTYAEIIDLPMKVVTSSREMRRALDELQGLDLTLIDTAGRSPRDELKIQELKTLLTEAQVDEVHLVLSLVASPRSLQATAERFAPAGVTSMILTKLDEAIGMGAVLSVARHVPFPISYVTTGQDVPDDIEVANAWRLSRLILGEEQLTPHRRAKAA